MSTSTENLIDALVNGLNEQLPALLEAQELTSPSDDNRGWNYGQPELTPSSRTPYLAVDCGEYDQQGISIGGGIQREPKFAVYAFISGPDPEVVARMIHRWGDCLVTAVEKIVVEDLTQITVERVKFSPNLRLRGGSVLFRAVAVEVSAQVYRASGSGP